MVANCGHASCVGDKWLLWWVSQMHMMGLDNTLHRLLCDKRYGYGFGFEYMVCGFEGLFWIEITLAHDF